MPADPSASVAPEPPADPAGITSRQEFARALTALREAAGLGVREVARAAGLPASTVGDYFGGAHLPPVTTAPRVLAEILHSLGVDDPLTVRQWQEALRRVRRTRRAPAPTPPYRGLHSFQPADAAWFFGRERLTELLLSRLGDAWSAPGGVIVVGPSGSGKSSLLRAGLVPALRRGDPPVPGPVPQHVPVLTPGAAPLEELARSLSTGDRPAGELAAALRAAPGVVPDLLRQAAGADGGNRRVTVLVVDQLEEIFTLSGDTERRAFLDVLRALTGAGPVPATPVVRVVFGLRADFYPQALRDGYLAGLLQRSQMVVGPMTGPELRRSIVEPAAKAGVALEDGLVELLLREIAAPAGGAGHQASETAYEAGALPLLSHALLATWQLGQQRMGIADYQRTGGIRGAVAATAEQVYTGLDPGQRETARRLLLRLVHVSDDTADTRRRVPREELATQTGGAVDEVLDRLVEHRLVTVDAERVEISHEALLVAWPRLRDWLAADRAGLRTQRQLGEAASAWRRADRDPAMLYRGTPLATAVEWAADPVHDAGLNPTERDFLDASVAAELAGERTSRRSARRLRQLVAALTALVLVAAGLTAYSVRQRDALARERNLAISRQIALTADGLRGTDVAVAMQLSLAAYRVAPTAEARASLLESFVSPAVARMTGGPGVMQAVAVSRDGQLLAGAGADGEVRVWRLDAGQPGRVDTPTVGHTGTVFALAFSPDGRTLASAGQDGSVRLWDATAAAVRPLGAPLTGPGGTIYALAFSPDGHTLVAGCADGLIWRWSMADRNHPAPLTPPLAGFAGPVQAVAFRPDGRVLAAGGADNTVRLWDTGGGDSPRPVGTPLSGPTNAVFSVSFSPDGASLAAGSKDGTVWLWGVADPAAPVPAGPPLTGPTSWVNAVAFGAGGLLAAGSSDGRVWLWDAVARRPLPALGHPGPVTAVAFLADGHTLASAAADGVARLWRLPGPLLTGPNGPVFSLGYTRTGHTLAVASNDNTLGLWGTGDPHAPRPLGRPATGAPQLGRSSGAGAITPDGRLAATGDVDGTVQLFDLGDPAHPASRHEPLSGGDKLQEAVAFRPDGRVLAVGGDDHAVRLWDVADPARPVPLGTLTGPANYVFSVAFSPDGRTLAAGSADDTVRLWDVADPAHPRSIGPPLTGATSYVYAVAFSPDGRTLAAGGADNLVRLWSVADPGHPVGLGSPLPGPRDYALVVAFSPDGGTLAVGGGDGTIWLWSVADPRHPARLATLRGPAGAVYALAYDPASGILASSGADKITRLWETDPRRVATWICASTGDPVSAAEWERYLPAPAYAPPCPGA